MIINRKTDGTDSQPFKAAEQRAMSTASKPHILSTNSVRSASPSGG